MNRETMIKEYTKAYQNNLSSSAEKKIQKLDAEAEKMGLRFEMTNQVQYMLPNFIGKPKFELVRL